MILPLTLPSASSSRDTSAGTLPPALAQLGSSELFLLELQGELEVSGDKRGQLVGRLTIDDDDSGKGKPTLRIGHHLLEGKIVSLPKPLAVLQRVRDNCGIEDDNATAAAAAAAEGAATPTTSYAIRTLVRKKIVFSKRPTPIVGLSAKTMAASGDTAAGASERDTACAAKKG
ncbi:Ctf8-domain-containing protein [Lactifluus subvellereus]|nr:Ctf8-domain-containing protein [Lactifluus subvellereus]